MDRIKKIRDPIPVYHRHLCLFSTTLCIPHPAKMRRSWRRWNHRAVLRRLIIRECGRGGGVEGCTVGPSSRFMAPQQRHPTIRRCIIRAWGVKIAFSPLSLRDAFFWRAAWRYHRRLPSYTLSAWDHHHHHHHYHHYQHTTTTTTTTTTICATCTGRHQERIVLFWSPRISCFYTSPPSYRSLSLYLSPFYKKGNDESLLPLLPLPLLSILTRESDRS